MGSICGIPMSFEYALRDKQKLCVEWFRPIDGEEAKSSLLTGLKSRNEKARHGGGLSSVSEGKFGRQLALPDDKLRAFLASQQQQTTEGANFPPLQKSHLTQFTRSSLTHRSAFP
ncbi:hypothetical protein ALO56_200130 [Pseudomonas viridiflava]|nr:hypothetical protein ALO56_200130 [Pseudomonas viridiflava]